MNSSRIGCAKSDCAIYRAAAECAGVPARRCLFVDDTAGHVRAAETVGMIGLVYSDAAEFRTVLGPALA